MTDNIIINSIAPIMFAYGTYNNQVFYSDKVIGWLEQTKAEANRIITGFESCGVDADNAWQSQALIELKTSYCEKKRCLECYIGNKIIAGE